MVNGRESKDSLQGRWLETPMSKKRRFKTFPSLTSYFAHSRRWIKFIAGFVAAWVVLSLSSYSGVSSSPRAIITAGWQKSHAAVNGRHRDGFRDFIKDDHCNFSSNDIHHPFTPLCMDRKSLLDAMSWGGRLGWDLPYWTRGCDMQWFTSAEVCKILSRFDHIYILGDSLMRHLSMAILILIRGDLSQGAKARWMIPPGEEDTCFCRDAFVNHDCLWKSVIDTPHLLAGDPDSIKCPKDKPMAHVTWHSALSYPIPEDSFSFMRDVANRDEPNGRTVFVLEHGLWNDLEVPSSMSWFEQVNDAIETYMPAYADPGLDQRLFPRLFISPQAQGEEKPDVFVATQNNLRLQTITRAMRAYVTERGYEHLGLFNMTVQATSTDGTHTTLEANLMKAMMVLNWLNMIDPPEATEDRPLPSGVPLSELAVPLPTEAFALPAPRPQAPAIENERGSAG